MEVFRANLDNYVTDSSLTGVYRGIIEDVADPLTKGRARVRVFGVHTATNTRMEDEGIPTDQLPWAEQVAPIQGGNSGFGNFGVPLCGTIVFCFFERGNHLHPRYFGTLMGMTAPQSNNMVNAGGAGGSGGGGSGGKSSDFPPLTASTASNVCQAAADIGCGDDPCVVQAIAQVESGGRTGFTSGGPNNGCIVRYEPHWAYRYFSRGFGSGGQARAKEIQAQYGPDYCSPDAYGTKKTAVGTSGTAQGHVEAAMAVDRNMAIFCTSWGKYQVMGFNYQMMGYSSLDAFYQDACNPNRQEAILVNFIGKRKLQGALKSHNWGAFATAYNGSGGIAAGYDRKMQSAYEACVAKGGVNCSG